MAVPTFGSVLIGSSQVDAMKSWYRACFPDAKEKGDLVELAKGDHLVLRYGVLIHEGGTEDGNVAEYYQRFLQLNAKK